MATYKMIQIWVKQNFGFIPETCWITHVKEMFGLPLRKAPNRKGKDRMWPCPPEKVEPIQLAFRHFKMID